MNLCTIDLSKIRLTLISLRLTLISLGLTLILARVNSMNFN